MPCPEFAERLSAYLDGEVGEAERGAITSHLKACVACRAELAAFSRLGDLLRAAPAETLGEDLSATVLAQVAPVESSVGLRWLWAHRRSAVAAAGIGLVLAGTFGLLLWRTGPSERVPAMAGRPPATAVPYLREHALYSAGQPLADRSSLILTSFGRGEGR